MNELTKKVETILFMAKEPISTEQLQKVLEVSAEEIVTAIDELRRAYTKHAVELVEIANGFMLTTLPEYASLLGKVVNIPQEVSLSSAAMETLAIIAYRQPVTKAEIESVRGVNSDGMVKSLLDKCLVTESGISDAVGRPVLYSTTDHFLQQFGLKDNESLKKYFEENIVKASK